MELSYILADPSGNTTAFVLSPVPTGDYGRLARQVMARLNAEQVAFVHSERMDMMGGEFCGNASRSYALWKALHRPDGLSLQPLQGEQQQTVTVSGAPHPLTVTLRSDGSAVYYASIQMPLPNRVLSLEDPFLGPCTLVEYPGISHILLENRIPNDDDAAAARELLAFLAAEDGCFGLLYLEENTLRPRVLVRDTDTDVWESSCASGTCAAVAAIALRQNATKTLELFQPGGSLTACATVTDGKLTALTLDGPVTFPRAGRITL